jgi:proteasome lid subunit RPN8/RPN11
MIALPGPVEARIRRHAEATFPNECCGVLLGRLSPGDAPYTDRRHVTDLIPVDNARAAEEQYHRFTIEPETYLQAELTAAQRGLDLLGFYHSHPEDIARPSDYDRERALPNLSYIVVAAEQTADGPRATDLTSWELTQDRSRFLPEPTIDQETV